MGWPQWVLIILLLMDLGLALGRDGQPKGNYSFGYSLLGSGIMVGLLWVGGFWS